MSSSELNQLPPTHLPGWHDEQQVRTIVIRINALLIQTGIIGKNNKKVVIESSGVKIEISSSW